MEHAAAIAVRVVPAVVTRIADEAVFADFIRLIVTQGLALFVAVDA